MFRSGLLILTSPVSRVLPGISTLLTDIQQCVKETLYVHIVPGLHQKAEPQIYNTEDVQELVNGFYSSAASSCSTLEVRVLLSNIVGTKTFVPPKQILQKGYGIVLSDIPKGNDEFLFKYAQTHFPNNEVQPKEIHYCEFLNNSDVETQTDSKPFKSYDHTVIGGTFDGIHAGHKILLSKACLLSQKSLTIGVTEGEMNAKKTLCELIKPTDKRIANLHELLNELKPTITYKIVPITDPFGPSIVDENLNCIVVSEETLKGGDAVNAKRKEKGLSVLDVHVINLVEDCNRSTEEEEKISSSSMRKRTLGTLLRKPRASHVPGKPYIIGMTGGSASGKSSICKRFEKLGAGIVDCDKLGHKAYLKDTPAFQQVVEAFGPEVVGENGEINRKVLGSKVFADKSLLTRLNGIVWPAIAQLAKAQIEDHTKQGKGVIILDAAVLLEAGWEEMVNEIWVSIVPAKEGVQRIQDRDKLSEERAFQRIRSQMSNQERVDKSNVVLSTLWEPEVTQIQVEKAWQLLKDRILPE